MTTIRDLRGRVESAEADREHMKGEIREMSEQLRDVMFYLQTRDRIESDALKDDTKGEREAGVITDGKVSLGEAAGGSISVVTSDPASSTPTNAKKNRKKKK